MFRNAFAFVILASALALTGCSKCSEQPAADAPAADMAAPAPGAETAPADAAAPAPGAETAPADATAPGTAPTPEAAPPAAK